MRDEFVIGPDAVCVQRKHPVSQVPGAHFCLVCTLIYRRGGEHAVAEIRRDEKLEDRWLFVSA